MLSPDRAVDNILNHFKRCGFKEISHNRCFLLAIVEGIYDEMIENGDIIIKKPLKSRFGIGEMTLEAGSQLALSDGDVDIGGSVFKIKNGEIVFNKIVEEEYRIV